MQLRLLSQSCHHKSNITFSHYTSNIVYLANYIVTDLIPNILIWIDDYL